MSTRGGKLSISNLTTDYGFLWVPCSRLNTLLKINTNYPAQANPSIRVTEPVVGYYRTAPQLQSAGNPSRTAVDADGNVWVGHRDLSDVVRVGLIEKGQCVDRNNDGKITTSGRSSDPLDPYPSLLGYININAPEDECITHRFDGYTLDPPYETLNTRMLHIRAVAVDKHARVWMGCTDNSWPGAGKFHMSFLPDPLPAPGSTAATILLGGSVVQPPFQCDNTGGYGYVIDDQEVLWSSSLYNYLMRYNISNNQCLPYIQMPVGDRIYGLGIDRSQTPNVIYTDGHSNNYLWKVTGYTPSTTVVASVTQGLPGMTKRGVAVGPNGDIWVASTDGCQGSSCHISRVNKNTGAVTSILSYGDGPTGVAVDSNGKVWFNTLRSHTAERIDPATNIIDLVVQLPAGCEPYTYGT